MERIKKKKARMIEYPDGTLFIVPYSTGGKKRYHELLPLKHGSLSETRKKYRVVSLVAKSLTAEECALQILIDAVNACCFLLNPKN